MHKDFFVHIIRHKPQLFQSMLAFNGQDELRSTKTPVGLLRIQGLAAETLWAHGRARRRLVDYVTSDGPSHFWDFAEESRRLALLPPELLDRAVLQFGVALHADELSHLIAREDVLTARGEIGPELFAYALQRGRFQAGSLAGLFGDSHGGLAARIRRHGRQALSLCSSVWPRELLDICATRFAELAPAFSAVGAPDNMDTDLDETLPAEARRAVWFGFKKILLKEVAPQWAPCFD
ncbi:hypothetical protein H4684_000815 [Desulfomicrobium macestii]|uniref:Uncharacterized protein n=1 Tax=Desulfomicrobium macestii TaxID=90731 RepID=A0ABR9H0H1_9BACT|nr:hypothetical protein [Desulfomicrobium macestii]MBE1424188.1 hypothetical protein [Desulfomicrobium macestii]